MSLISDSLSQKQNSDTKMVLNYKLTLTMLS